MSLCSASFAWVAVTVATDPAAGLRHTRQREWSEVIPLTSIAE
jgi:hypothetical protein